MNRYIVFTPPLQGAHERFVHDVKERLSVAFFEHSSKSAQHTPHSATLCAALFVIR